jgi:hypothetical protein
VVGYPVGGDSISVTKGVVSRVDMRCDDTLCDDTLELDLELGFFTISRRNHNGAGSSAYIVLGSSQLCAGSLRSAAASTCGTQGVFPRRQHAAHGSDRCRHQPWKLGGARLL